jgi:hypothetical protein
MSSIWQKEAALGIFLKLLLSFLNDGRMNHEIDFSTTSREEVNNFY